MTEDEKKLLILGICVYGAVLIARIALLIWAIWLAFHWQMQSAIAAVSIVLLLEWISRRAVELARRE